MRRLLILSVTVLSTFATSATTTATAAVTKSFRQTTAKDFEEGEATASMVLPTGDVVPGMKSSAITLDAAFVWCGALSPDGRTAYFGTGDQGRIFAVDTGATGGKARLVTTLEASWVTALAVKPDGTLIAGTTPGGRVYTVDPKNGKSKVLTTLTAEHVWALALDAKSGTIYAGTGGPGKIAAIEPGGRTRALWDSGDKHVVSLITADDKHLFAGTSEEGILYKVGLDGRAEALADFDAEEVRALVRHGGALYAAVNDFEKGGGAAAGGPGAAAPRGTRITVAPSGSPASAGSLPRPGTRKAKAALYRIDPDGRMEQMFAIPDGYFTALTFDDSGRALRRHRQRGPRLPRLPRSHRGAGDRRSRTAGADPASRRQRIPRRHRRRGRHLPGRAGSAAPGDLSVARARRRIPIALGPVPLARNARRRHREPVWKHRQARRDLDGVRAARSSAPDGRGRRRTGREPARALRPVPRDVRRARGPPRGGDAGLPAAEPARAHHRARHGGERARAQHRRAGGAGGDECPSGSAAHSPDGAQAALEGREPRR
jgi:hypothetical protein